MLDDWPTDCRSLLCEWGVAEASIALAAWGVKGVLRRSGVPRSARGGGVRKGMLRQGRIGGSSRRMDKSAAFGFRR